MSTKKGDPADKADEGKGLPAGVKTAEAWCAELGTADWLFAAARALKQWPIGKELDQAAYTAALNEAANVKLGG